MTYLEFREQWHGMGCFNVYQIRAWKSGFDRSNLTRWVKRGYLSKLRQDWYAFSDLKATPEMARFIAQRADTAFQTVYREDAMMRSELDGRNQES